MASENPLNVKLKTYEGPLDLLLDLIKKNEVDIYDIPIAEITGQYLQYLSEMNELDLEIAGEWLVIAATLLWIKSKMLLPDPAGEAEKEGEDPRSELVRKLIEYQTFRQIAKELGWLAEERSKSFTREIAEYYWGPSQGNGDGVDGQGNGQEELGASGEVEASTEGFSRDLYELVGAFHRILSSLAPEKPHEVLEPVIPIEQKIEELKELIRSKKEIYFEAIMIRESSRLALMVAFLALLEIVRKGLARIFQAKPFGNILIQAV